MGAGHSHGEAVAPTGTAAGRMKMNPAMSVTEAMPSNPWRWVSRMISWLTTKSMAPAATAPVAAAASRLGPTWQMKAVMAGSWAGNREWHEICQRLLIAAI